MKANTKVLVTYTDANDSAVRIFVCKPGDSENVKGHRGRIVHVDD